MTKNGENVVNYVISGSKTQILRNTSKFLRDRTVAWLQLLEALLVHFTPFTQPTQFYTEKSCTCCGSLVQKPVKEYSEKVRSSQEASGSIKVGQKAS